MVIVNVFFRSIFGCCAKLDSKLLVVAIIPLGQLLIYLFIIFFACLGNARSSVLPAFTRCALVFRIILYNDDDNNNNNNYNYNNNFIIDIGAGGI